MERQPLDNSREEIDLIHLFNSLLKGISYILLLMWKNLLVFLGIFLLVSGLGYSLRYIIPRSYVTKGVFVSRLLPVSYCNFMINSINDQVRVHDVPALTSQLHISPGIAGNIHNISAEAIPQDTTLLDKDDPAAAGFSVEIKVTTVDNLDSIQNGLIHYLEENNFALARKAAQKKNLLALKNTLSEKLMSLDSLKKNLSSRYSSTIKERGIIFGEPADPVSVYQEEMKYYKEQLDINEKLANPNSIEVLQPFVRLGVPNYPNISKIFKVSLAAGLLLALIITPLHGLGRERKKRPA
jgi:hypothetical protein